MEEKILKKSFGTTFEEWENYVYTESHKNYWATNKDPKVREEWEEFYLEESKNFKGRYERDAMAGDEIAYLGYAF